MFQLTAEKSRNDDRGTPFDGAPVNNVAAAYWFQCPAEEEQ